MRLTYFLTGTLLTVASTAANAQVERCSDVLISNNVAWQYDSSVRIATMNLIDRSNFEEKKKSLSIGGDFIVDAIPISAFASYDDFNVARQREVQKSTFKYDRSESAFYIAQYVPREAFASYTDCLRIKSQQTYGLHLIPIEVASDYVSIDLLWNSPPPVQTATLKTEIEGGSFTQPPQLQLPPSNYYPLNIKREPDKPLRLTVSANGFKPERLAIPAATKPPMTDIPPWEITGYRPRIEVVAHIQSLGDQKGVGGEWVGTKGRSLRLEGFAFDINDKVQGISLEYMCHIEGYGDTAYMGEGTFCGTRGEKRRVEGFAAKLVGPAAQYFSLNYSCHIEGVGDAGPMTSEQYCGTRGDKRRIEALMISIVRK